VGSSDYGQGPLKPDTINSAISAIRSVHIDRRLPTTAFDSAFLKRVLAGIRRIQSKDDKKKAGPLMLEQLEKITKPAPDLGANPTPTESCKLSNKEVDSLNFDTALKVAFSGFFRTKEITYEESDLANKPVFEHTKLQRRDITFAENDEHVIITLRESKNDYDHTGVEIVLACTNTPSCPVTALRALLTLDPQPRRAPLFRTHKGAFNRNAYVNTMRVRLKGIGVKNYKAYAGHSPRRGAAQHASDNGILDDDIQRLGRWSSQAFKGYFAISLAYKFALNKRFLTGKARPVIYTSLNM
jgi:hypothetical protein